ncbi:hypothetical protein [Streptomyces mangrovi]
MRGGAREHGGETEGGREEAATGVRWPPRVRRGRRGCRAPGACRAYFSAPAVSPACTWRWKTT